MPTKLKLLILEDSPYDAEIEIEILEEMGYTCHWKRVETRAEFLAHLDAPDYDLILADYSLPAFDGLTALKLYRERRLELPFIFVSGELGEEIAIESLKAGATDYVLKNHLSRLGSVVERALREKKEQRERKRAEEALRKANRAYRVLSDCNKALVRTTAETELLQEVCRIIVEVGGYRLAWVGFVEQDEGKAVRPVAQRGYETGYLNNLNISWADTEQGQGPIGIAIRTGKLKLTRNILTDPSFAPWRDAAIQRGYASSIALPLLTESQTLGALSIYAPETDAFDNEEVSLLMELADEVTYGLVALRTRSEHRQAERVLEESERRFRSIAQSAIEAIMIVNEQDQIVFWNKSAQTIFGYSENEVLKQPLTMLMPKRFREAHQSGLTHFKSNGHSTIMGHVVELYGLRKDGHEFPLELSLSTWQTEKGIFYSGIIRDISTRKEAEERLWEGERRLNLALRAANAGVWEWDMVTNQTIWSVENYYVLGLSPGLDQTTYDTWLQCLHPEDRQVADQQMVQAVEKRSDLNIEFRVVWPDGTVRWINNVGKMMLAESGQPIGMYGVQIDITERKHAEQERERLFTAEREQRLQAETLREVTLVLTSQINLKAVLDEILNQVQRLVPYKTANITLLEGDSLHVACWQGYEAFGSSQLISTLSQKLSDFQIEAGVVQLKKSVVVSDTHQDPRWVTMDQTAWIRSNLVMPICQREHVLGLLRLDSNIPDEFNIKDVELLEPLLNAAAIALEKARLYEQAQQEIIERKQAEEEIRKLNQSLEQRVVDRTRELSALYEVTAVTGESLDLEITLEQSLDRVLEAMRTNMGIIHLLDGGTGRGGEKTLSMVAQQGFPADIMPQRETIAANSGLAGWVIEHGEVLIVPDVVTDPRLVQLSNVEPGTTYIGVPIRARGQVLGTLSVLKKKELSQFSMDELTLLTSIADHVGVVVESARLHHRAEQAAVLEERGRLSRELHDSVTQLLYALTLFAKTGRNLTEAEELEGVKQNLEQIGETAQQALTEMRLLVYELRPLDLNQEGLATALRRRLNAVEGRTPIKTRIHAQELGKLPLMVEQGFYRIAQEALNNALKHAAANSVTIYLHLKDGRVELEVVDDGIGFDPAAMGDKGGIGLISMQERAQNLGGSLTILSTLGEGTRIKASIEVR